MPMRELYHRWHKMVKEMRPEERITRTRNFAYLLGGLYQSRSVHLSKIADKMPGQANLPSKARRLGRFLDNNAIQVREWYEPVARMVINRLVNGEICLVIDGSKIGFGHQLLMIGIAYRKRTIPLVWTWVKGNRGHSSPHKQIALLAYVHKLIPAKSKVLLVGDTEFASVETQKLLKKWRWSYVLRQKGRFLVKQKHHRIAQRLDTLVDCPGQSLWLTDCRLTMKHSYRVNLLAYWKTGETEPWLLATNLSTPDAVLRAYRKRMWLEETFGDLKRNGFDLESTHLRHFLRLSRLTLAVAFLYVWLVAFGSQIIKNGQRSLVDRSDRRDHSIFRIGRNMVERLLSNGHRLRISFSLSLSC